VKKDKNYENKTFEENQLNLKNNNTEDNNEIILDKIIE
jgi:hypothetical protein